MLGIWDTVICIAHKRLKYVATRCVLRAVTALTALPRPLSCILGRSGKERGREGEGKEREGKEGGGMGGKWKGRGATPRTKILAAAMTALSMRTTREFTAAQLLLFVVNTLRSKSVNTYCT